MENNTTELQTMSQVAPQPTILSDLVGKIQYKKGWSFWLEHKDRGQGSEGLTLVIHLECEDSYNPGTLFRVVHYMIVPAASYNETSWKRWLFDQILLVERHEACEFFKLDGHRCFPPHHGPGYDPYQIFEMGTLEDAQTTFRGEHFEAAT